MDLRLLKYFLTVVQEENISRAAEMLHITQPTLSRQMKDLEEILGKELFVRGKHLQLTEAGIIFYHRAKEIVQLLEKTKSDLIAQEDLEGTITIGCGGQQAVAFILDCMDEFQRAYPKVNFDVFTSNADSIREKLDRGLLDFGILLEPVDLSQFHYIRLKEKDRWGLLMKAGSALAQKEVVFVEDLYQLPLVMTNRLSLSKEIRHYFGESFERLHVKGTYNVVTNIVSIVASGRVYALTIDGAISLYDPEKLIFRPLYPTLSMSSVLAWKKFNPGYSLSGKFLEYIQNRYKEKYTI